MLSLRKRCGIIYSPEDASYDPPEPTAFPVLTSASTVPSEKHVCMELPLGTIAHPKITLCYHTTLISFLPKQKVGLLVSQNGLISSRST